MGYEIVSAEHVLKALGEVPIVDVRPAYMYEESRIPGALSAPLIAAKEAGGDVAETMALVLDRLGVARTDSVIVYCYNGGLAREACDLLASRGFAHLSCYEGSWVDWISDPTRSVEH